MIAAEKAIRSELSPFKDWRTKWSIAAGLLYPNRYSLAMSNLGFQTIFRHMHDYDYLKPLRFFTDMELSPEAINPRIDPASLPLLLVTIPFELDILNLITFLKRNNIPLSPQERESTVLIGGGAAIRVNPEPYKAIFDVVLTGDSGPVLGRIMELAREHLLWDNRQDFIEGVQCIPDMRGEEGPLYSPMVSSLASFRNMFLVEMGRSCPFRCGFCATPYIYGKHLNFPKQDIIETVREHNPGTDRVGLVGSAVSEHPDLLEIVTELEEMELSVSTSSIRIDRIGNDAMEVLARTGARSITIAPETHVPRLAKAMGKNITPEQIVERLHDTDFREIKLYYIIGLPDENDADMQTLADGIGRIQAGLPGRTLSLSVNPFIPKPCARWGNSPMESDKTLNRRFAVLGKALKKYGIKLTTNYSFRQRLEAIIATGDIDTGRALLRTADNVPVKKALKDIGIDPKAEIGG